ncbi:MAG: aspartyl protease family protein [Brevinema sp.]
MEALVFSNSPQNTDPNSWSSNSFRALVDTGATHFVITSKIIDSLGLFPLGKTNIVSASQVVETNTYQEIVGIPITEIVDPKKGMQKLHAKFFPLQVTEMPDLGQEFDILIGMDIIQNCLLVVHQNSLIFSF